MYSPIPTGAVTGAVSWASLGLSWAPLGGDLRGHAEFGQQGDQEAGWDVFEEFLGVRQAEHGAVIIFADID